GAEPMRSWVWRGIFGARGGGAVLLLANHVQASEWPVTALRPAARPGPGALTTTRHPKPAWGGAASAGAHTRWTVEGAAPAPTADPAAYAAAFNHRYGLHPAPYANDGLPMGLRRGNGTGGIKSGIQLDCMVCNGGSIGGASYVGLGNS